MMSQKSKSKMDKRSTMDQKDIESDDVIVCFTSYCYKSDECVWCE